MNLRTFIDLFCGIGGFRLALEQRGLQCVFSSEIDPQTRETYYANFGERPVGDIRDIDVRKIPPHDILCAGFPCQSFTISGKKESVDSSNGKLFYEMMRVISFHRPQVILLENVRHLLRINDGEILSIFEKAFQDTGYTMTYYLLNASLYGIAQTRIRVYFVGIRKDIPLVSQCPLPTYERLYLCDLLEETVDERLYRDRPDFVYDHPERLTQKALGTLRIGYFGRMSQSQKIYSPTGHAVTQMTDQGKTGLYRIGERVRYLSLREGRRVMGFPDHHHLSSTIAIAQRQLGNAVIPKMVGHVYDSLEKRSSQSIQKVIVHRDR